MLEEQNECNACFKFSKSFVSPILQSCFCHQLFCVLNMAQSKLCRCMLTIMGCFLLCLSHFNRGKYFAFGGGEAMNLSLDRGLNVAHK